MDRTIDTPTPRYLAIAQDIEGEIRSGRLSAGTRLPSERDMARDRRISRMTARQAMQHLAQRGLLEAQVGRGTFVRSGAIAQELTTLTGFSEDMARLGRESAALVIEAATRAPDPATAAALGLGRDSQIHRLARVRLVEGAPVAIEISEIDADRTPGFFDGSDFARQSSYALLRERFGIAPTSAEQTLEAAAAEGETAMRLDLPQGAPILRLTRLTRDAEGRPFEFVRSLYRGDAFNMKVHLTLGGQAE
ncbi:GntR family transcriptional regulator [Palleronia sp. LCG004]|uniref:GntR family transcriptional regulator n=1 Tax=Palleronia sp. LCG004 TaxID=3079304 RepID=UPI0029428DA1|nr:GntR family transcriptional regulator [Palleronia sp. LCG004]WOI55856.1 GntR family transcriptional regulator [Palleronia sp. LCG004]